MTDAWDRRFLEQAALTASWSKDPSTKCGAVIVNAIRQVLGQGFNGFPRGVIDTPERYADRPTKYAMIVHSEANAILNARQDVSACTLYTTKFPCSSCTKLIIQAGITEVVCPAQTSSASDLRWADDALVSRLMLDEAGVRVRELAADRAADDESRCAWCGWPLKPTIDDGCIRGNCSQRPLPERFYAPDRVIKENWSRVPTTTSVRPRPSRDLHHSQGVDIAEVLAAAAKDRGEQ